MLMRIDVSGPVGVQCVCVGGRGGYPSLGEGVGMLTGRRGGRGAVIRM